MRPPASCVRTYQLVREPLTATLTPNQKTAVMAHRWREERNFWIAGALVEWDFWACGVGFRAGRRAFGAGDARLRRALATRLCLVSNYSQPAAVSDHVRPVRRAGMCFCLWALLYRFYALLLDYESLRDRVRRLELQLATSGSGPAAGTASAPRPARGAGREGSEPSAPPLPAELVAEAKKGK